VKYDTATPYIASYVIVRQEGKIAFVLRSNTTWMNGFYGLPSGKVEKKENYLNAAIREAKEEIGIDIDKADLEHALTMHRQEESGNRDNMWVDMFFEVKKWQGEPINAEPNVHGELVWLDPAKLPKNVVPSVKYALKHIEAGQTYAEYGWE